MRKVELHDLKFHAFHGVGAEERRMGGKYSVTVVMDVDFSAAEESDALTDTLNYEAAYHVIRTEMETPSQLIEHVAGRIVKQLRKEFRQIQSIEVRLTKYTPPVEGMDGHASVTIRE